MNRNRTLLMMGMIALCLAVALWMDRRPVIVFEGDSLTVGAEAGQDGDYPSQLLAAMGGDWKGIRVAKAADTLAAMAASTFDVDRSALTRQRRVALLWAGTNDLFFGGTVEEVQVDYEAWCRGRRALGFEVYAFTLLPGSAPGTPHTHEADRQAFNAWLRAHWSEFADGLVDVAADDRIGDKGDELDTRYYADRVHLTATGYAIVAELAAALVKR